MNMNIFLLRHIPSKYREYIENIAVYLNIVICQKVHIFSMIRYDTINRYQKRYIDIFDISSHHYYSFLICIVHILAYCFAKC